MEPVYLATYRREPGLRERLARGLEELRSCRVCPRNCEVDRLADDAAACHTGRRARVASCFAHFGEEDCLRGHAGSGTIFFSYCNLRCVFCQNHDISQADAGSEVTPDQLAQLMLGLQRQGCHNINFVTPEHVVPQVLEALPPAIKGGLAVPLVYNTSGYDAVHSLQLMDGLVDIYMPDLKFWGAAESKRLMKAADYPEVARAAIREMHRQVGDLVIEDGLAVRGLLVRHLVMPGGLAGSEAALRWLRDEISPDTYVNVMDQYRPDYRADRYPEIARPTQRAEHAEVVGIARDLGLRVDERDPHPQLLARMSRSWFQGSV